MKTARRDAFFPVLTIALIAASLAACGVKGDLEAPPGASAPDAGAKASSAKVLPEKSSVQRVKAPGMSPVFPPEEWKKDQVYQSEQKAKAAAGAAKKRSPNQPFILDGLL